MMFEFMVVKIENGSVYMMMVKEFIKSMVVICFLWEFCLSLVVLDM